MSDAETPKRSDEAPAAAAAPAKAATRPEPPPPQQPPQPQRMSPQEIPDFEERKLSSSELREYADSLDVAALAECLVDGRAHVRINAARAIGIAGGRGDPSSVAPSLGLLLRDSVPAVRREVAIALGKLGKSALPAAPQLVGALGDSDGEVADEASGSLAGLGADAEGALVAGLDAGDEQHGRRVALLIGKLPNAVEIFTTAFTSPAVNVQVNSAIGLGLLGGKRVGAGLPSLLGARTGGDGRTRDAVRRALEMLKDDGPAAPTADSVDGFEERLLNAAAVDQQAARVSAVGVDGFVVCLQDGRDLIRANAATALGALGPAALTAVGSLGALLRDDSSRVRLAAAAALDRVGDAAVLRAAADLVGALRSADAQVAEVCARVLSARKARVLGALVRGLETDDELHARRILELINVFPDASELLIDAFASPAVNVQVNAALGLGMLGDKVGKGRKALEGARTGGYAPTREAVRKALAVLDGPQQQGPNAIDVAGFETQVLAAEAFASAKLRLEDLAAYAQDGRAIVRANAATALGSLGATARGFVTTLAALLRDDDNAVRSCAARAIDKLGDDAVREVASALVTALRSEAEVAKVCAGILAARKTRVLTGLVRGLETDDETHARRILELINALPDAGEVLVDAFASPAENVQVNAAIGLGMLGAKRAGTAGRKVLEGSRTGGFARTRDAVFKALAMLDANP
jgi:HEAT repeat protein